jgi:membrane protein DedA with SNARE-associated domain
VAHEWVQELIQGIGESLSDILPHTTDWRAANRIGLLLTCSAIIGALMMFVAAFGGKQMPVVGWWLIGGYTAGSVLGATICFWLGSRPED